MNKNMAIHIHNNEHIRDLFQEYIHVVICEYS